MLHDRTITFFYRPTNIPQIRELATSFGKLVACICKHPFLEPKQIKYTCTSRKYYCCPESIYEHGLTHFHIGNPQIFKGNVNYGPNIATTAPKTSLKIKPYASRLSIPWSLRWKKDDKYDNATKNHDFLTRFRYRVNREIVQPVPFSISSHCKDLISAAFWRLKKSYRTLQDWTAWFIVNIVQGTGIVVIHCFSFLSCVLCNVESYYFGL